MTQTLKNAALAGVAALALATTAMLTVSSADAQVMRGYGERGFFPGIAGARGGRWRNCREFQLRLSELALWPRAIMATSFGTPYGYRPYGY